MKRLFLTLVAVVAAWCAMANPVDAERARRVGAKQTLLIHVCHDIGRHEQVNAILPDGIDLAYDGQVVTI